MPTLVEYSLIALAFSVVCSCPCCFLSVVLFMTNIPIIWVAKSITCFRGLKEGGQQAIIVFVAFGCGT